MCRKLVFRGTLGLAGVSSPSSSLAAPSNAVTGLPLHDQLLSTDVKMDCMLSCLGIFDLLPAGEDRVGVMILQAGMQLLAHVTRDVDVRVRFKELNGPQRILHRGAAFPAMSSYSFTITQQVLEPCCSLSLRD